MNSHSRTETKPLIVYVNKHCHCFRSGTIYKKAVYREYVDATFKKAKPHPPELGKLILKIFSYHHVTPGGLSKTMVDYSVGHSQSLAIKVSMQQHSLVKHHTVLSN